MVTLRDQIKAAFPTSTIQPWLESLVVSGSLAFDSVKEEVDVSIKFDVTNFWDKLEAKLSGTDTTRPA